MDFNATPCEVPVASELASGILSLDESRRCAGTAYSARDHDEQNTEAHRLHAVLDWSAVGSSDPYYNEGLF